jgi:hypothetical protein
MSAANQHIEDKRSEPRERCFIRVIAMGGAIVGYIVDIATKGFKVRIPYRFAGALDPPVRFQISLGEKEIKPFELAAEVRWRKDEQKTTLLGLKRLEFESPEAEASYFKLIDYYHAE